MSCCEALYGTMMTSSHFNLSFCLNVCYAYIQNGARTLSLSYLGSRGISLLLYSRRFPARNKKHIVISCCLITQRFLRKKKAHLLKKTSEITFKDGNNSDHFHLRQTQVQSDKEIEKLWPYTFKTPHFKAEKKKKNVLEKKYIINLSIKCPPLTLL